MEGAHSLSINNHLVAIVDDDQSVLRGLRRLLDAWSLSTAVFRSGEEFLDFDGMRDIECVVLDIHLEGISGIETRRRLAELDSTIPVIFMTGVDTETVRKEAMAAGCVAYLSKPFSGDELVNAIRKAASLH